MKVFAIQELVAKAEEIAAESFERIARISAYNQRKVILAMQKTRVSETHFSGSTGYGYGDTGREKLDDVYAEVFKAGSALARHQITTGTQAIGVALFGNLRPGDELLSITGRPYDSLEELIGIRKPSRGVGSLSDFGVTYNETALDNSGKIDADAVRSAINSRTKLVLIQRSRGYNWREALSIEEIGAAIDLVKGIRKDIIVFVDNCYGEFCEEREPTEVGADIIAGSLIKNPGGGIAPSGGYIAGVPEFVENAAYRLTVPGLGREVGATLGLSRLLFQGLYFAPHVVGESLKGAVFCAALMSLAGYEISPSTGAYRSDIIQAVKLGSREALIAFCKGIQQGSAVDSFVSPEPWAMPGYEHEIIMAAGAFVQGSSIELSADGPMKPPYIAYVQGGLVYESVKMGCVAALENIIGGKKQSVEYQ